MNTTITDAETQFATYFPDAPTLRQCQVPGRINLLGEHLDYNGLPVLPMTINRYLRLYYAPAPDAEVHIANTESTFPPRRFQHTPMLAPSAPGAWENYVKAALQAINTAYDIEQPPGLFLLVASDLPKAMGLSSSTALVIATALAYLDILGQLPKDIAQRLVLAELLAEGEHYVGTRGGGMDQAILLLGSSKEALKIDFHPLRSKAAPLFTDHVFVVADSLERAEKSREQRNLYNAGPLLCNLCRCLLEMALTREQQVPLKLKRLADLWQAPQGLSDAEILAHCHALFPEGGLSLAKAAQYLGQPVQTLREHVVPDLTVDDTTPLPLRERMRHQLTEHQRVRAGLTALQAGDAEAFGALMTASHASCRDDYAISTPALDELVSAAMDAGALGARLTGAGLGGAVIALIPREHLPEFRVQLISTYYRPRLGEATQYPVFGIEAGGQADYHPLT